MLDPPAITELWSHGQVHLIVAVLVHKDHRDMHSAIVQWDSQVIVLRILLKAVEQDAFWWASL